MSKLMKTIQALFTKTPLYTTPEALPLGFRRLYIVIDDNLEVIENADGTYQTMVSKIMMDFKAAISGSIEEEKKRLPDVFAKREIQYLEQLGRLAKSHQDRFLLYVNIRGSEPVGIFQFRCARTKQ